MSTGDRGGKASGGGGGPCGACKFLRRKCVRGCVFAPYFDSDQGTAHFAAVHRVFGASNASKLLLHVPPHCRLDAVVTLCYEALARVRDPVYGCVGHIFTLQQQVVTLQAELAYTQARISTLQRAPPQLPPPQLSLPGINRSSARNSTAPNDEDMSSFCNSVDQENVLEDDDDLQTLAREYVSRYFPGVRFRPGPGPDSD
ncbi:LOB domain-containing protein [Striga asiatica]|uniref:LOB domain-containing protein n=1 Tax=Striga asiatica TaxID=4170 RepID=A0A5A7PEV9_STRAF|nr:LOB domain-containing protein [Striga asiatica]